MNALAFRRACLLAAVVGLFPIAGARAQPDDKDRQRATGLLRAGAALMEKKEPAAALEKFTEAFAVFPSAKIQFNIALANRALGRAAAALRAFDAYLKGAPTDDTARRKEAAEHARTLRARVALVEITTDVAGAAVLVDGVDEGRTPLPRPLVLDPGPHNITLEPAGGGAAWTRIVRAEAGGSHKVEAALAAPPPAEAAAEAPVQAAVLAAPLPAAPAPGRTPFYKKAWFWTAVGVGVTAAATGVILGVRGAKTTYTCPMEPCLRGQ